MPIGQQAGLARTLGSLDIDVCCFSETRLQDPTTVLTLLSPTDHEDRYHQRLSGDPEAASACLADVGIALSGKAEAALLDSFPSNSRLCEVRLRGSCRINRSREERRSLFVVSAYSPTDCSSGSVKDDFYRELHQLLTATKKSDVIVLLLEHRYIYYRPTIAAILDICTVFDSVIRPAISRCLLKTGLPEKYTAILRALYLHTSGRVRIYGKLSSHFVVNIGVRQGGPMSPFLSNFAIDAVLSSALDLFNILAQSFYRVS
ncbi:unnamed protein product, partial [Dicrocoelium dendriticum]